MLFAGLCSAFAISTSAAHADTGEGVGKTEITCNRVTWSYSQFADAENNRVEERIKVAGEFKENEFVFNGPEATHTTTFESPEGEYQIDAHAHWKTNGVKGGFDHHQLLNCRASMAIEKEQRIAGGNGQWTKKKLTAKSGETVEYRIKVTNNGNRELTLGELIDPGCDAALRYGGETRSLPVEQSTYYECERGLGNAGLYPNIAEITATTPTGREVHEKSNEVLVEVGAEPDFELEKGQRLGGQDEPFTTEPLAGAAGETLEYQITVRNTGNAPLEFSPLVDAKCEGIEGGPEGLLGVGEEAVYTCHHVLSETDCEYMNVATLTGVATEESENVRVSGDGTPVKRESNTVVACVPQLTIEKQAEETEVAAGEADTYTITVTNPTAAAATEVTVEDQLPEGVNYTPKSATAEPASGFEETGIAGRTVTWKLAEIPGESSVTITVPVTVDPSTPEGTLTNVARTFSRQTPKPKEAQAPIKVTRGVQLNITKTGPDTVATGSPITWKIVGGNAGPSTATEVSIVDPLPSNTTYVSAVTTKGKCTYSAPTVTCQVGDLVPGEKVEVTIDAVSKARSGETITNVAVIKSREEEREAQFKTTGTKPAAKKAPVVTLSKTVTPREIEEGHRASFHIRVLNTGPVTALHVRTCDRLPAHLILLSSGGGKVSGGTICWTVARLARNASRTYTISVRSDLKFHGLIVNRASTTGSNFRERRATATLKVVRAGAIKGKVTG